MAKLHPPVPGDNQCDFLEITISEPLSQADYDEVRGILATAKPSAAKRTIRFAGSDGARSVLTTAVYVHATDEPANAVGTVDRQIAAHLHVALTIETGSDVDREELSDEAGVEGALEWVRENRNDLSINVSAGRTFSSAEYTSVLVFPDAPKPFTAVRGVSLVREHDEPRAGSSLYEVYVRDDNTTLMVSVSFRSKLFDASDALEKLLDQASEIAGFGVRKRETEEIAIT